MSKTDDKVSTFTKAVKQVFKSANHTLKKLQENIYKKEQAILDIKNLKDQEKIAKQSAKIERKIKKIEGYKELVEQRQAYLLAEMTSYKAEITRYKELIVLAGQKPQEKKTKEQLKSWEEKLKACNKEIEDYNKLVNLHDKQQVGKEIKQEQKQQEQQQKQEKKEIKQQQKRELSYQEEKEKFFKICSDILKDQTHLEKILSPLAEPRTKEKGIAKGQAFKAAIEGIQFAVSHAKTTVGVITSGGFYAKEIEKLQKILNGEEKYDPSNSPFFIKLLQDSDTKTFLAQNVEIINGLVENLAPILAKIALKELGKIDEIQKDFNSKKDDIQKLPELDKELQKLKLLTTRKESKIKELEEKIDSLKSLQAKYDRAILLQELKKAGFDEKYINSQLLPIVKNTVVEILKNPENIIEIVQLTAYRALSDDPQVKKDLLGTILDKIDLSVLIKNDILSKFLINDGENIAKALQIIIGSNTELQGTLSSLGMGKELLPEVVPVLSELIGNILANHEGVSNIYEALKPVILDNTDDKVREAKTISEVSHLDKQGGAKKLAIVKQLPNILLQDATLTTLKERLPDVLAKNKTEIANIAVQVLPKLLATLKSNAESLAQSNTQNLKKEDIYKVVVSPIVPILANVSPEFYGKVIPLAIDVLQNTMKALSIKQIKGLYQDIQTINQETGDIKLKDQATERLVKQFIGLLENADIQQNIKEDLPNLLRANTGTIKAIVNNISNNNPQIARYGVPQELIDATVPLIVDIVSGGLSAVPELVRINSNLAKYQNEASNEATLGILSNIIDDVGRIAQNITPLLTKSIPAYLQQNKDTILTVTKNVTEQKEIKASLDPAGVKPELVLKMAELAIDTVPQILPIAADLVNATLKDKEGVTTIITKIQDLVNSPEQEKIAQAITVADSILDFINKPKNVEVRKIIDKDIPNFLGKNAERFGSVVDEFLNTTVVGRNLKVKGQEIIELASKKIPDLTNIAEQFKTGNYNMVMFGIFKLLSDKKLIGIVSKTLVEGARFLIQRSFTSLRTRRQKWSKSLDEIHFSFSNKDSQQSSQQIDERKLDLGELLQQQADATDIGTISKTVEYSLISRDFRGLVFDKENPIPTENVIINGFNFDNAIFKERSFQNSEISNCSFKGAIFKDKISFEGATIDAKSLKTLLSAINQYNKNHANNKITLDNVKIVGDISGLTFKDISMKGTDLTEAQFTSEGSKSKAISKATFDQVSFDEKTKLPEYKKDVQSEARKIGQEATSYVAKSTKSKNSEMAINDIKDSVSKHVMPNGSSNSDIKRLPSPKSKQATITGSVI
ncbi:hypothetical protein [Candidatus Tisiphia endosymbiont of Ditula angustiorana]|uniref:hypothetical protein n=1 Tax=Candidatus Tisiphia endosymbiont of Ditula angustiorana TaxID=3066272 RepID=UPI00312CAB04